MTLGCFILAIIDDKALIEHEKVHVRQFYNNPFMPLLYLLSKSKRFEYELEAYSVQLGYMAGDMKTNARTLAALINKNYFLHYSIRTIESMLIRMHNDR